MLRKNGTFVKQSQRQKRLMCKNAPLHALSRARYEICDGLIKSKINHV